MVTWLLCSVCALLLITAGLGSIMVCAYDYCLGYPFTLSDENFIIRSFSYWLVRFSGLNSDSSSTSWMWTSRSSRAFSTDFISSPVDICILLCQPSCTRLTVLCLATFLSLLSILGRFVFCLDDFFWVGWHRVTLAEKVVWVPNLGLVLDTWILCPAPRPEVVLSIVYYYGCIVLLPWKWCILVIKWCLSCRVVADIFELEKDVLSCYYFRLIGDFEFLFDALFSVPLFMLDLGVTP